MVNFVLMEYALLSKQCISTLDLIFTFNSWIVLEALASCMNCCSLTMKLFNIYDCTSDLTRSTSGCPLFHSQMHSAVSVEVQIKMTSIVYWSAVDA